MHKRITRLEAGSGTGMDYLPVVTVHEFVIGDDGDPETWPGDLVGARFADGSERLCRDGENGESFRHRLSVEHGIRGPAGALPFAVVDLIRL